MLSKTSRVISSKARQPLGRRPKGKAISQSALAEFLRERSAEARSSGKINLPSSQPTLMLRVGGASLCRDDTIDEILVLVDNCYIISKMNEWQCIAATATLFIS